jgi:hypothetical protein
MSKPYNEILLIDAVNCVVLKSFKIRLDQSIMCDIAVTLDNKTIICGGQSHPNIVTADISDLSKDNIKIISTNH